MYEVVENFPKQFSSPEEEISYLRQQIANKERELLERSPEADSAEMETLAKKEIHEYGTFTPNNVLSKEHQMQEEEVSHEVATVEVSKDTTEEIVRIAQERGIHNALTVLEKTKSAHTIDDVHRRLIELIKTGVQVQNLKEGVPPWQVLHMTLFEVALPEFLQKEETHHQFSELISIMEQFYAGMQNVGADAKNQHYVIEIAVADNSDDIIFYVALPNPYVDLFTKQVHSLYPDAQLIEQQHDYNIFVENGQSLIATAHLAKHPIYPLKTEEAFGSDPLDIVLNAFSKIEKKGGGASLQFVIKNSGRKYYNVYDNVIKQVRDGSKVKDALMRSSVGGEVLYSMKELLSDISKSSKADEKLATHDVDSNAIELFTQKIKSPIIEANIRIAVSAQDAHRASQILSEIKATFHQFENTQGNSLTFKEVPKGQLQREIKAYSFREFSAKNVLPLSLRELATLVHFAGSGIDSSPQFKQSRANTASAPTDMPQEGTLLGINKHRGVEKEIYVSENDRMRHFYVIGQTGTGKSVFLKNMIIQDIQAGHGVCMIDPHGTDIADVLSSIPKEREDDVIYFDPANLEHVIGLNMLEYDQSKPEQKTFVVNELFSIFQRLYGANPESMGPMFEQYFRNATLLVMEDPESGNTLMDISRVMSDASYRRMKLSKAKNPVVTQFWQEIATKAGGEAALENIVPYIVSKFDVFTANDYMRPIIGQQQSSFNFRKIMDERKILLVNLSKGRLGEINANLIGMIVVGKLLMAALSRVDDASKGFPPFFLHIDEFQNVTTDSISAILSEARKYKLGLTVAHQFIAQLDEGIRDAVFGNVGSMATFRVGPEDSKTLEHQFAPVFDANDLMNIPNYNAYLKILANGSPTKPFSVSTMPPPEVDAQVATRLIQQSAFRYGRPKAEIEAEIAQRYQKTEVKKESPFDMMK